MVTPLLSTGLKDCNNTGRHAARQRYSLRAIYMLIFHIKKIDARSKYYYFYVAVSARFHAGLFLGMLHALHNNRF